MSKRRDPASGSVRCTHPQRMGCRCAPVRGKDMLYQCSTCQVRWAGTTMQCWMCCTCGTTISLGQAPADLISIVQRA